MRAAFIVVGAELRAWEQAETLLDYLKKVAGIRHATICPGWNRDEGSLKDAFTYHATKAAKQPLLLSYIGHGYKDACSGAKGWSYGMEHGEKDLRLPYATLHDWIAELREGPTLILNDCCYAGALEISDAADRPLASVGVIASSVADGYSYGALTQSVIDTWMDGEVYVPRNYPGALNRYVVQEARFGPELDRHFFPCPKKLEILRREAAENEMLMPA